ncbi:aspartate aminotransferase family protein, partial [Candidatus Bathyarchaeota archaeon]
HWGVEPDIMATAKGLSSGYLPLGAVIASDKVYDTFKDPFAHGHTFGSHPVACAAGVAVIDHLEKHRLVERSAKLGGYLLKQLETLRDHPSVGDIRGLGLFAGIEFVRNKESKEPFPTETKFSQRVLERCIRNGLLVYPGTATVDGVRGDHIQVAPPLVVTRPQIDEIVELLDRSIAEAEREVL